MSTFNFSISVLIVLLQVVILFLISALIFKGKNFAQKIISFFNKNYLVFGFLVSFGATFGSLIYSEIFKLQPCPLCWYQRILMYPQFLIFSLALVRRDNKIYPYIILLSLTGILISSYHYFLQITSSISRFCIGNLIDCSLSPFTYFGYINIPMMSLTSFLFLFLISLIKNSYDQKG